MRVIAGSFRSRVLQAPPGLATRPTSDRLRETLFNVLAPRIEGARFLDLYAGSGAVGIEALSRGAAEVVFVERAAAALKVLRANLAGLGLGGAREQGTRNWEQGPELTATGRGSTAFRIVAGSAGGFLRGPDAGARFDLVFLDPPYDAAGEYEMVLGLLGGGGREWLAQEAVVIAEHRHKDALEDDYGALGRTRFLKQGDAALSFYANRPVS